MNSKNLPSKEILEKAQTNINLALKMMATESLVALKFLGIAQRRWRNVPTLRLNALLNPLALDINPYFAAIMEPGILLSCFYTESIRIALHHCSRTAYPINAFTLSSEFICANQAKSAIPYTKKELKRYFLNEDSFQNITKKDFFLEERVEDWKKNKSYDVLNSSINTTHTINLLNLFTRLKNLSKKDFLTFNSQEEALIFYTYPGIIKENDELSNKGNSDLEEDSDSDSNQEENSSSGSGPSQDSDSSQETDSEQEEESNSNTCQNNSNSSRDSDLDQEENSSSESGRSQDSNQEEDSKDPTSEEESNSNSSQNNSNSDQDSNSISESGPSQDSQEENSTSEEELEEESNPDIHLDGNNTSYENPCNETAAEWREDDNINKTIENIAFEAMELGSNDWGTMSNSGLKGTIIAVNTPKIDQRQILKRFGQSVKISLKDKTRMKPNRRKNAEFGSVGKRSKITSKILFAVDTSGSMAYDAISLGITIATKCLPGAEINLCYWDTIATEPMDISNLSKMKEYENVCGGGGTNPSCVFDMLKKNKHHYDGVIIFSDMFFPSPCKEKKKTIWISTTPRNSSCQSCIPTWGTRIELKELLKSDNPNIKTDFL